MRLLTLLFLLISTPASALYEGLQCVPYARAVSGIEIRGDAHSWWGQAEGRYDRGDRPRVGAVLAFKPHGSMRLGHIAAVRKILDKRTILISHANWSTIDGQRGHIEENVRVIDVSDANDWSVVQVWYTPVEALGTTRWPVSGFIYPDQVRREREVRMAVANLTAGRSGNGGPPVSKGDDIQTAAYTPKAKTTAVRFQLSSATLSDVSRAEANEKRIAWQKPAPAKAKPQRDEIGDLLGALGT